MVWPSHKTSKYFVGRQKRPTHFSRPEMWGHDLKFLIGKTEIKTQQSKAKQSSEFCGFMKLEKKTWNSIA